MYHRTHLPSGKSGRPTGDIIEMLYEAQCCNPDRLFVYVGPAPDSGSGDQTTSDGSVDSDDDTELEPRGGTCSATSARIWRSVSRSHRFSKCLIARRGWKGTDSVSRRGLRPRSLNQSPLSYSSFPSRTKCGLQTAQLLPPVAHQVRLMSPKSWSGFSHTTAPCSDSSQELPALPPPDCALVTLTATADGKGSRSVADGFVPVLFLAFQTRKLRSLTTA